MTSMGFSQLSQLRSYSCRHCFISLPHRWINFLTPSSVTCFLIESESSRIIVSWSGITHNRSCLDDENEEYILLEKEMITINNFTDGEVIHIKQIDLPHFCSTVSVSLLNIDEWETLAINFEHAQNVILNQVRVIKLDQYIPIWLEGGARICMKVEKMLPSEEFSLLNAHTEVEILSFTEKKENFTNSDSRLSKAIEKNCPHSTDEMKIFLNKNIYMNMEVHPFNLTNIVNEILCILGSHPSLIIVSNFVLAHSIYEENEWFVGKVNKVSIEISDLAGKSVQDSSVMILVWENFIKRFNFMPDIINRIKSILFEYSCIASDSLRRVLSLEVQSVIKIGSHQLMKDEDQFIIEIYPISTYKSSNVELIDSFKEHLGILCKIVPVILNHLHIFVLVKDGVSYDLLLRSKNKSSIFITCELIFHLSVIVINKPDDIPYIAKSTSGIDNFFERKYEYLGDSSVLQNIKDYLLLDLDSLNNQHQILQFAFVQGAKGTGKTSLVENINEQFSIYPYFIYCHITKFKSLKGKRIETIESLLMNALMNAMVHQRSLLIFDDIDCLIPRKDSELEGASSLNYIEHGVSMLRTILTRVIKQKRMKNPFEHFNISILATCISCDSLHSNIGGHAGSYIFSKRFKIPPLNNETRRNAFDNMIFENYKEFIGERLTIEELSCFNKLSMETVMKYIRGFCLSDLSNLLFRIFLEAKKRWDFRNSSNGNCELCSRPTAKLDRNRCLEYFLCDEDFNSAIKGFNSSVAKDFQRPKKKSFKIGGLSAALKTLSETILWSTQYSSLFEKINIRMRSGILLYGPPGCGKTLLANSLMEDPELKFINIKGPELLSKYIGQSEKSVRDVFIRAQKAAPCILFFDEFDSLAPRRGHDNTGVTDRVVNQLLTEMDGVEGLEGVYVIAASSRPDLIDPALLRPGRIDKCIHCPMPNANDRAKIFTCLSEGVQIDGEINWNKISSLTENFTGADIQGVLSTAQIKAVEEAYGNLIFKDLNEEISDPIRRMENVQEASKIDNNETIQKDKIYIANENGNSVKTMNVSLLEDDLSTRTNSVSVTERHILSALDEIKPSLNEFERIKYDRIHQMFSSSSGKPNLNKFVPSQRETLA